MNETFSEAGGAATPRAPGLGSRAPGLGRGVAQTARERQIADYRPAHSASVRRSLAECAVEEEAFMERPT
jgi:hypothetical protein